jgi:ribosomal protein L35AE/L33A
VKENMEVLSSRGILIGPRNGMKKQYKKQYLVRFEGIDTREKAKSLIGSTVFVKLGKKKIQGKVVVAHGNNGVVRVRLRKGLPGWASGSEVEIIPALKQKVETKQT